MWIERGTRYSRVSPMSLSTTTLRIPLWTSPRRTVPSISVMIAGSLGLRASKSSTTRGRPPVMSLVFVVSRGILTSVSPG